MIEKAGKNWRGQRSEVGLVMRGRKQALGLLGSRNTSFCGGANGSGTKSAANAGFEAS
jgi:hypothetical protein